MPAIRKLKLPTASHGVAWKGGQSCDVGHFVRPPTQKKPVRLELHAEQRGIAYNRAYMFPRLESFSWVAVSLVPCRRQQQRSIRTLDNQPPIWFASVTFANDTKCRVEKTAPASLSRTPS